LSPAAERLKDILQETFPGNLGKVA
jgi:hypothetical protein